MKLSIVAGAVNTSVNLFIRDSSSNTGNGLTGLTFNSAGLTAAYSFAGANAGANVIGLATLAAANSAWSAGGFLELSNTSLAGWYRFDLPNNTVAAGKGRSVAFLFKGAVNMAPCPFECALDGWDNQDGVRGGLTALPNANAQASGGLFTRGAGAGQVNQDANGRLDANVAAINTSAAAAVNQGQAALAIARGVVTTGSSVTSIVTSSITPAAAVTDQYKGRVVIFDAATATANLRGQATVISGSTSGGVLTVAALSDAPASSDSFGIY